MMNVTLAIRPLKESDYTACAKIYQRGLDTGVATFETQVPDWNTWNEKFLKQCRYVAIKDNAVVGWIALTPFSNREVYKGVAEVSLYIADVSRHQGIGKALLQYLVDKSDSIGFWTLQAKIFPQNNASISLFTKCGFRQVGIREKLGMRDGIWYDNILMERRNKIE